MGILGLPNVVCGIQCILILFLCAERSIKGKSSLFNLLTEQSAAAENFPFCTIDPNESRCPVPDARFNWLCDLWQPASIIPAYLLVTGLVLSFRVICYAAFKYNFVSVDIAGLIRGASEGAGLGNAFLSHIQAVGK